MMGRFLFALSTAAHRADAWLTQRRKVFSVLSALLFAGVIAVYNVSSGPLHNLNDIGGWANRAMFIALSACVHGALLMMLAVVSRCNYSRIALRQAILTAGYVIALLAINQKGYMFVEKMLPAIRAMQQEGMAAALALDTGLSAGALLGLYALSTTPIYPMYMLKLAAIASLLAMAVLMMRAAEKHALGMRVEALLALCVILPQGFMHAACSALPDVTAIALLMGALALLDGGKKKAAAALLAVSCAFSGVCLYALPAFARAMRREKADLRLLAAVPLAMAAVAAVAVACGASVPDVLVSYARANIGAPIYASGAPGMYNLIPRALVEEIPQYASVLRHMPQVDALTNDQPFYTQGHFEIVMLGLSLAGFAVYVAICMIGARMTHKSPLERALIVTLGALIVCPGATGACWLAADMLCLYAILAQPKLRLPSCMVLFATMTSASYPMTEEVMLPMVYAFALCLGALLMLLDVIPTGKEEIHE